MEIIEYFNAEGREHWLAKISESGWSAGEYLSALIRDNTICQMLGDAPKVLMLTEGDELISFCTLSQKDDIQPTDLTPWLGFAYTFPCYRGHRYLGKLIDYAEHLARADGAESLYISTGEQGLYEKYSFVFLGMMKDVRGEDSRVYIKKL